MDSRTIGQEAEAWCKDYLLQQGLKFIAQNYHSRFGEIDLVFLETLANPTLVFVEVRYRASANYGSGAETVTYHKQKKLIQTAQIFLQNEKRFSNHNARFDVVSVTSSNKNFEANWQINAFEANAW